MSNRLEKIKNLWSQAVFDYDSHMQKTGHYSAQENLLGDLKSYLESPILDLATGPGFLAEKLLESKHEVTLNDFSDEMFTFFSNRFRKNSHAHFSNQDAHSMDLKDLPTFPFKTIICCNLFYYLENRVLAINNWKKLLKNAGAIILLEEYPFHRPDTKEMKSYESELMALVQPLSPGEIEKQFIEKGFKLIDKRKTSIDKNHNLYGFVFKLA